MNYLGPSKKKLSQKIRYLGLWLLTYLEIQLFITLCAWPFLQYWGLPISCASIIGNLLFAPFLTAFLFLSSLIFFCELLYLPYYPLLLLLEGVTQLWYPLLIASNRSWLFTLRHPPFLITLFLPLCTGIIIHSKPFKAPLHRITVLALFFFTAGFAIPLLVEHSTNKSVTLNYFDSALTIIRSGSTSILSDPGCLGRRLSAQKKVRYTLVPFLVNQGINSLTIVHVTRPSIMVFRALQTLITSFPVQQVYIPAWQGATLNNSGWAAWEQLLRCAQKHDTTLTLVDKAYTIQYGSQTYILTPKKKVTKRNGLHYHAITITS